MYRLLNMLGALSLLTGCGPVSMYYQPGVSVSRQQTDLTNCEVAALRDAPVANQIRQGAPIYYPGGSYCYASGRCVYRPGYWRDGPLYTVDVNRDLRGRVLSQCMARRGYTPVDIPRCPSSVTQRAPVQATTRLPELSPASCIIPNQDGSWQIVDQG